MTTTQLYICQYCINNINEVDNISKSEYVESVDSHGCTFCYCDSPKPAMLLDNSAANYTRLVQLLNSSDKN